jgi:O-antigen/teichoic acid export membrane protein
MKVEFLLYFIFKSFALVSFVLSTPVLLGELGEGDFGIWSTLNSFVTWVLVLDFGVGNFLRNKISELTTQEKHEEIFEHLTSSLLITGIIATGVFCVLTLISYLIDWNSLLGLATARTDIFLCVFYIVLFTSGSFVTNLIYFYFYGKQKSHVVAILQSLTHGLFILCIYIVSKISHLTLSNVSLIYGLTLVSPGLVASYLILRKNKTFMKLTLKNPTQGLRDYVSIGGRFFFIQITALILFSTDKILLSHLFGPQTVSTYEIVFKVFSMALLFQSLLLTPSWGKYSRDFFANNIPAIKSNLKFHLMLFGLLMIGLIVLVFLLNPIIRIWLHKEINNPMLIWSMMIFVGVMVWNNVFAIFLNATNHIDLTFKICIIVSILNVPLSYFLATQTPLGESGIVWGTIICLLPAGLLTPIQTLNILRKKL